MIASARWLAFQSVVWTLAARVRSSLPSDAFSLWTEEPSRVIVLHESEDPDVPFSDARKVGFTSAQGQRYHCYLPGREGRTIVADLEASWSTTEHRQRTTATSVPSETSTTSDETGNLAGRAHPRPGEDLGADEMYVSSRGEPAGPKQEVHGRSEAVVCTLIGCPKSHLTLAPRISVDEKWARHFHTRHGCVCSARYQFLGSQGRSVSVLVVIGPCVGLRRNFLFYGWPPQTNELPPQSSTRTGAYKEMDRYPGQTNHAILTQSQLVTTGSISANKAKRVC